MRAIPYEPGIIDHLHYAEPQIFFDDARPETGDNAITRAYSSHATLLALDKLMCMLNSRRDWEIVKMRAHGLSYEYIAAKLRVGVATIVRLMRRIEADNPQLGHLLHNAAALRATTNEPNITK